MSRPSTVDKPSNLEASLPSARLQEQPEAVDRLGVFVTVVCRQTPAHIVLNPLTGEVASFSEGDDATRLQITQQRVYRDDQIVPGNVIPSAQRPLPQRLELNVRLCQRAPATP
jgi:hypothetical protein